MLFFRAKIFTVALAWTLFEQGYTISFFTRAKTRFSRTCDLSKIIIKEYLTYYLASFTGADLQIVKQSRAVCLPLCSAKLS